MQATYALEDRRVLGRAPRSGVLDLDPRTIMGVLLAASVVAFMSKSLTVELGLVLGVALLQALTGHVRMALAFAGGYAVLWAVLNLVFPHVGGVAATMFTISFTFSRKIFLCLMVGSLLVAECSVHRLTAALERLRVPQVVLIPLTVTMRYFPALKDEMAHIRAAMRHFLPVLPQFLCCRICPQPVKILVPGNGKNPGFYRAASPKPPNP